MPHDGQWCFYSRKWDITKTHIGSLPRSMKHPPIAQSVEKSPPPNFMNGTRKSLVISLKKNFARVWVAPQSIYMQNFVLIRNNLLESDNHKFSWCLNFTGLAFRATGLGVLRARSLESACRSISYWSIRSMVTGNCHHTVQSQMFNRITTWWSHDMHTLSALLTVCKGICGGTSSQRTDNAERHRYEIQQCRC